ncbi:hypothetical protein MHK_004855 [Candidatus Magnetomorum sp. HK-1]|nr:hypothetical protein MHK_004855 [Candidatus Magnetomorum sp. HK-1]
MENNENQVIGYSALRFDDCYEYNENACYIADSPDSLKKFIKNAMFDINDYKIEAITAKDILRDYGLSGGEFAMEPKALQRLKKVS